MPYNISVGWKTRDVDRGIYGEGNPRAGYEPRPVEMVRVESGAERVKDFTTTRCDRYCADVRADELEYR